MPGLREKGRMVVFMDKEVVQKGLFTAAKGGAICAFQPNTKTQLEFLHKKNEIIEN
jgi:hypothetical protein